MGVFSRFTNRSRQQNVQNEEFVNLIRALDNEEEWAINRINELWNSNEPTLVSQMNAARIQIYGAAARAGDPKAQYWMGISLRETDMQGSLKWLIPLANQGNIDAMIGIALGYTEFGGYGENSQQYRYWYMKAAEAGDADAQATIGLEYTIDQNYEEALKWYSKAAEQGYAEGSIGVAKCLEHRRASLIFNSDFSDFEKRKAEEKRLSQIIEEAYIDAVNTARKREHVRKAFSELGHFYERLLISEGEDLDIAKRAAYFLYNAYLIDSDFEYELKSFNDIVNKYGICVDTNDIEGWADREGLFS